MPWPTIFNFLEGKRKLSAEAVKPTLANFSINLSRQLTVAWVYQETIFLRKILANGATTMVYSGFIWQKTPSTLGTNFKAKNLNLINRLSRLVPFSLPKE